MIRGSDGEEIPGTKLIISEIPISFSNTALEAALIKKALSSDRGLKWRKCETEKGNRPNGCQAGDSCLLTFQNAL